MVSHPPKPRKRQTIRERLLHKNKIENCNGNSVANTAAPAGSAIRQLTTPVVPVPVSSITMQPDASFQISPRVQVSNTVDENLVPGVVTIPQPVTPGANEAQPLRVAFDTDPSAIPPTSITKQSDYPTLSGGLGNIWVCSMTIDLATLTSSTEVHMMLPCESRQPISVEQVAVKEIRITDTRNKEAIQKATKRLRREVNVWIKLRHAHILTLHGTVSGFGPLPALVSTWMQNGALNGYLERTSLTTEQKLKLLKQVVDGLKYLHEQGVIHGDLTSKNVLIDRDGNAFLADFGLSLALAESDKSYYQSYSTGAVRWSAPELINSANSESILDDSNGPIPKPNSQSDVFSLGCIMLYVFSGKPPFWWIESVTQVFGAQYHHVEPYRLDSSVTVSDQHLDFMWKCWSANPEDRPSAGDAASFVETELASVPSPLSD